MEVIVVASGSSGNAVLVRSGGTSLLIDAGLSALQVRRRLESFGRAVDDVAAVLVTHEHSDHACGVDVLARRHRLPVWATAGTWSRIDARSDGGGEMASGCELAFGGLRVQPVATSHDAAEPVAVIIDDGTRRVALCTDTGVITGLLEQRLAGCDVLLVETNHDADMLRHGSYPWPLKQRIASRLGHLGNHQTEEAMDRLRSPSLRAVVGMHLSAENNSPDLVRDTLRRCAGPDVPVEVVTRTEMLRLTVDGDGVTLVKRAVPPPARRRSG